LSPISTRKKRNAVVQKDASGAELLVLLLEAIGDQRPARHRDEGDGEDSSACAPRPMACMSHAPTAPAAAWLSMVAAKIPATIGHGRLNRVAEDEREELGLVADLASARRFRPRSAALRTAS
jgi:hypothetical protein